MTMAATRPPTMMIGSGTPPTFFDMMPPPGAAFFLAGASATVHHPREARGRRCPVVRVRQCVGMAHEGPVHESAAIVLDRPLLVTARDLVLAVHPCLPARRWSRAV